jgi:hypothetical protein
MPKFIKVPESRSSDETAIMRDRLSDLTEDLLERSIQRSNFLLLEEQDRIARLMRELRLALAEEVEALSEVVYRKENGIR